MPCALGVKTRKHKTSEFQTCIKTQLTDTLNTTTENIIIHIKEYNYNINNKQVKPGTFKIIKKNRLTHFNKTFCVKNK